MCCGKTYCPFLEIINNAFALGDILLYQESSELSDLVPGVREHFEDIVDIHHQIAKAGLEDIGFSFNSNQLTEDPLNDSGIHIVKNPGFGYDS